MGTEGRERGVLPAVFLLSAAAMADEVLLVRLLSLRFWPHFVPLVISQAMLGLGAAGVALTLARRRLAGAPAAALSWATLAAAGSFDLAFRASGLVPLDPFLLLWQASAWPAFAVFFAVLAVPFLLAGMATGLPLAFPMGRPGFVYGASFAGSGAGAILSAAGLALLPTGWLLRLPSALGLAAALWLVRRPDRRPSPPRVAAAAAVALLLLAPPPPLALSPYKDLAVFSRLPGARILATRSGRHGDYRAITAPGIHIAPGLSLDFRGEIPPQAVILADGELAGVVPAAGGEPPRYLSFLPAALPYRLVDRPSVLQLGLRGTEGVLAAAAGGAASVTVVEPAKELLGMVAGDLSGFSGGWPARLRVELVAEGARPFLARERRHFDLVELADVSSATFASLGVHSAGEAYLLTREGLRAALKRAGERGLLAFSGWLKTPPRESVKMLRTLRALLEADGLAAGERVLLVRGWGTFAAVVRRVPFGEAERERAQRFCRETGFSLVWPPPASAATGEAAELSLAVADALAGTGRRGDALFDLEPASDDSPYFYRFLRPQALGAFRRALGPAFVPFVEWGVVFLLLSLPLSLAVASAALLAPAFLRRGPRPPLPDLAYFASLGLGYMLLELVFLKAGMLVLGTPVSAATAAMGGFTFFSGLGSALAHRFPERALPGACAAAAALGLGGLLFLDLAAPRILPLGETLRVALFVASLAPAAAVMGVPFPSGLTLLGRAVPEGIPQALAVNGFFSVAGATLASVSALWLGFRLTAGAAAALYLLAALLAPRADPGRAAAPAGG